MEYTKYEMAQMIGVRALQISQGAPFAIKLSDEQLAKVNYNPIEIARIEFEAGKIPLRVVRKAAVAQKLN
jgi:DNA-directed RNA polymerase subunit K/omega